MQIFHGNVLTAINLSLQKIFSSTKDKSYERKELRLWQSLCEKEGWDPPASQLTIASENVIVKIYFIAIFRPNVAFTARTFFLFIFNRIEMFWTEWTMNSEVM